MVWGLWVGWLGKTGEEGTVCRLQPDEVEGPFLRSCVYGFLHFRCADEFVFVSSLLQPLFPARFFAFLFFHSSWIVPGFQLLGFLPYVFQARPSEPTLFLWTMFPLPSTPFYLSFRQWFLPFSPSLRLTNRRSVRPTLANVLPIAPSTTKKNGRTVEYFNNSKCTINVCVFVCVFIE